MRTKSAWHNMYSYMKNIFFSYFLYTTSNNLLLSLVVQLVPLQLLPDGNGSVDRENAYHADKLRLLLCSVTHRAKRVRCEGAGVGVSLHVLLLVACMNQNTKRLLVENFLEKSYRPRHPLSPHTLLLFVSSPTT